MFPSVKADGLIEASFLLGSFSLVMFPSVKADGLIEAPLHWERSCGIWACFRR